MQPPIIVIGMHRSGTSLVANTLNRAGVFMGVFRDHNGEALHFLSLNQQMFQAQKTQWLMPNDLNSESDRTLSPNEIFAEHLKLTSPNKNWLYSSLKWGWKDPRNTYTLPFWLKRFPDAKVLHVVRDGRAVAMSLKNRNQVAGEVFDKRLESIEFNFRLWEKYVSKAMSYKSLGNQYLQVRYEALFRKDEKVLKHMDDFAGVSFSKHLKLAELKPKMYATELNSLANSSLIFKALDYQI